MSGYPFCQFEFQAILIIRIPSDDSPTLAHIRKRRGETKQTTSERARSRGRRVAPPKPAQALDCEQNQSKVQLGREPARLPGDAKTEVLIAQHIQGKEKGESEYKDRIEQL